MQKTRRRVENEKLLLLILATIQFTHIMDFMIIMPLGSQFMHIFEIGPQQFSMIVSIYAFSAFVAGLVGALFIDRFDRRHALLFLYIGFTVGTLACATAPTYISFLLLRALTGAFGGSLGALILSIVADVIPLERRASAMGWIMTAFSAASVVGVPTGIFLAAEFGWRAPFITIGGLSVGFLFLIYFTIPSLRGHLQQEDHSRPSIRKVYGAILRDVNQRRALLFTLVLMLGHFTIIPFIAPYMQRNIGFSDHQVGYIYAAGGTFTVFVLPFFGKLADRYGRFRVFAIASFFALFSIAAITNLPPVPLWLALIATSSFFVVASGRNVPATTMITAVVQAENRGSFMSVRQSVNEAALFISSLIAGFIVIENPDGSLGHYEYVGYLAIGMSIIAVLLASRLRAVA